MVDTIGIDDIKEGRVVDRFYISDIDTASAPIRYYGMLALEGDYMIMKEDKTTATAPTYRYAKGLSDYVTAWTGRAGLTYQLYNLA